MLVSKDDRNKYEVLVTSKHRTTATLDWSKQTFRTNNTKLGHASSLAPLNPPPPPKVRTALKYSAMIGRGERPGEAAASGPDNRNYDPFAFEKKSTSHSRKGCAVNIAKTTSRVSPPRSRKALKKLAAGEPLEDPNVPLPSMLDPGYTKYSTHCGVDFERSAHRQPLFRSARAASMLSSSPSTAAPLSNSPDGATTGKALQRGDLGDGVVSMNDFRRHVAGTNLRKSVGRQPLAQTLSYSADVRYDVNDSITRRHGHVSGVSMNHTCSREQADRLPEKERNLTRMCDYKVRYSQVLRGAGSVMMGATMSRSRTRSDARSVLMGAGAELQRAQTSLTDYTNHSRISSPSIVK